MRFAQALVAPVFMLAIAAPLVTATASAQPVTETADLTLGALGGAVVKVPAAWKDVKKEPALVVREQAADPANQLPFFVVLCAIEEGPPSVAPGTDGGSGGIPWIKVRDNIVESAQKSGRKVTLTVGDAFKDVAGFEGRRFQGELEGPATAPGAAPRKVAIELIALVKNQRLLTIGIVSEPAASASARDLVATIAKTARLGP